MHRQLWGYKVEEKLYVGVHEQKRLNTTALKQHFEECCIQHNYTLFIWMVHMDQKKCMVFVGKDARKNDG